MRFVLCCCIMVALVGCSFIDARMENIEQDGKASCKRYELNGSAYARVEGIVARGEATLAECIEALR